MKKVMAIIVMMVMIVMVSSAIAEDTTYYGDYRDNTYFGCFIDKYNEAFEKGERLDSTVSCYEGIVYLTYSGLNIERFNIDHFDPYGSMYELEKAMEQTMKDDGIIRPQVNIRLIGKIDDETSLFDISIICMTNLNEFQGEKTGNGFIQEGLEYWGMRVLGPIYH